MAKGKVEARKEERATAVDRLKAVAGKVMMEMPADYVANQQKKLDRDIEMIDRKVEHLLARKQEYLLEKQKLSDLKQ